MQEELLAVQKQYRAADMARLKLEDEVRAMQDRIESLRSLSKEREAALVQQLQTFRKTADKSSVSVRVLFFGFFFWSLLILSSPTATLKQPNLALAHKTNIALPHSHRFPVSGSRPRLPTYHRPSKRGPHRSINSRSSSKTLMRRTRKRTKIWML